MNWILSFLLFSLQGCELGEKKREKSPFSMKSEKEREKSLFSMKREKERDMLTFAFNRWKKPFQEAINQIQKFLSVKKENR